MRIGLQVGLIGVPQTSIRDYIAGVAQQAENAGFATLGVPDHFTLRPESLSFMRGLDRTKAPAVLDCLEAWTVLAFIAARTERIRLTTIVSGITMRYPAVLIKTADTVDALSNGRVYLGLGASPDFGEDEHQRMGMPFPPARERVARLEEVLQMAWQLWSGVDKPFEGTHYQLASTIANPFFVQKPHPPILIAGSGNKMLRLMARYADAVNIGFGQDLNDLRTKFDALRENCQAIDRPYEAIQKTTLFTRPFVRDGHLNPEALEYIRGLAELGIDEVFVRYPDNDPVAFEILATELLPEVEKIAVAGR